MNLVGHGQPGSAGFPEDLQSIQVAFEAALVTTDPVSRHHIEIFAHQLVLRIKFKIMGLGGKPNRKWAPAFQLGNVGQDIPGFR